jgi:hypothetical protein
MRSFIDVLVEFTHKHLTRPSDLRHDTWQVPKKQGAYFFALLIFNPIPEVCLIALTNFRSQ